MNDVLSILVVHVSFLFIMSIQIFLPSLYISLCLHLKDLRSSTLSPVASVKVAVAYGFGKMLRQHMLRGV